MGLKQFISRRYKQVRKRFRLVITDENTFEEKFVFYLTAVNIFVAIGTIILTFIIATILLISFSPLKEYIPGYTNPSLVIQTYENAKRADSLSDVVRKQALMLHNMKLVILGEDIPSVDDYPALNDTIHNYDTLSLAYSPEDAILRQKVEQFDKYELPMKPIDVTPDQIDFFYFSPVQGTIIRGFERKTRHFGVDVATQSNEPILATLAGMVISSNWTLETGYTITIQHSRNIISVYKHCSSLLRKQGDYVRAGEPIAFVGNSGEQTSGPHLHFELWSNGQPLNPREYISFR